MICVDKKKHPRSILSGCEYIGFLTRMIINRFPRSDSVHKSVLSSTTFSGDVDGLVELLRRSFRKKRHSSNDDYP